MMACAASGFIAIWQERQVANIACAQKLDLML